jgi:hypothetical protein
VVFCTTAESCAAAWAAGVPALRNTFTHHLHPDDKSSQSALKAKWLIAHVIASLGLRATHLDADLGVLGDFGQLLRVAGADSDLVLYWDARLDNLGAQECEELPQVLPGSGDVPDMLSTAVFSLAGSSRGAGFARWVFDRLAAMPGEQERGVIKVAIGQYADAAGGKVAPAFVQWPEFTETVNYEGLVDMGCADEADVLVLHCGHVFDEASKPGVLGMWGVWEPELFRPVAIMNAS